MTPNQATPEAWENVALAVLEQLGRPASPIDPVQVALSMGLCIATTTQKTGCIVDRVLIMPDSELDPSVFRLAVARRIARWVLTNAGKACSPQAVEGVARALLDPPYARGLAKVVDLPLTRALR